MQIQGRYIGYPILVLSILFWLLGLKALLWIVGIILAIAQIVLTVIWWTEVVRGSDDFMDPGEWKFSIIGWICYLIGLALTKLAEIFDSFLTINLGKDAD